MSTPVGYFEDMYAHDPDPWKFTTRWYEQRKYALVLAALPKPRYAAVFEPGCSIGVLSAHLAARCDLLLCTDLAVSAVDSARHRLAGFPHVRVERLRMPEDWPDGDFDLIVLSEIAYYLGDADLDTLLDRAVTALRPDGDLVAVHWRRPVAEHVQTGETVHKRLSARAALGGLHQVVQHEEADFLLDVHSRSAASVADREGLS